MFALFTTIAVTALTASGAPTHVSPKVDNPWFPLRPGTVYRYEGTKDGKPFVDIVSVTHKTKRVPGGQARVVHDRVFEHGRVTEDTFDWYAQDRGGTIWYFGEDTKELDAHGHVITREGSWEAGKDGAKAGIFMPAHPRVGQTYRQEYYKGHAEDWAKIVSIKGRFLTTNEWSGIERGVLDKKVYKRGVGNIREGSLKGGHEYLHLVNVKRA
jgi:hypothetical protein